jgi:cell division protein FtsB
MKRLWPNLRFSPSLATNIVGSILAVYLVVVLAQTVKKNYDLEKQIDAMQEQIVRLNDQRDTLTYNLQYYQTDSYKEKEARAKLGLQKPGEGVVILPNPSDAQAKKNAAKPAVVPKSNLRQWLDFLSGKA